MCIAWQCYMPHASSPTQCGAGMQNMCAAMQWPIGDAKSDAGQKGNLRPRQYLRGPQPICMQSAMLVAVQSSAACSPLCIAWESRALIQPPICGK